jgi:2-oxoglutarate ferredoxin oxidoreductase subunit alpha
MTRGERVAENKISVRIGGPAGMGIMQAGLMFSKCCSRIGLHVFDYIEYPSLIRGGHNTYQIRAEDEEIHSQIIGVDLLIALDEATLNIHADELGPGSLVIYDGKTVHPEHTRLHNGHRCPVPLKELAAEADGTELMQNTVALGAALGLLQYDFTVFEGIIKDAFKGKKAGIIKKNIAAAKKGYQYARKEYGHNCDMKLTAVKAPKRMVITGNEAIALGAVRAGLKFYAAYPMTPSSSILHTLAAWQERHNILVKQTEDEIGTVNMGMGAGFAGVRAMVGTSGGGFALMQEGISLGGITETPLVIVEVQRGGPGTGVPTFTEQADLKFVLNAGHGDFPRILLAPGDVEEAYYLTTTAFNLAEKYQTPVMIISDKYLGESHKTADFFDTGAFKLDRGKLIRGTAPEHYLRYIDTPDGISPRTIPGVKNGFFTANSDEHEPFGWSTEEIPLRNQQMEKRMRKLETLKGEMPEPPLYGDGDADVTIVTWGSMKGPVLDAMKWLKGNGKKVQLLHINWVSPFPVEAVTRVLSNAKKTLIVENNFSAQMAGVIREQTGILIEERLLRYDGRPVYPEQVYEKVMNMLGDAQ